MILMKNNLLRFLIFVLTIYAIMSRLVLLTKIVITGNKGGTVKTTIATSRISYLSKKKVNLINADPGIPE